MRELKEWGKAIIDIILGIFVVVVICLINLFYILPWAIKGAVYTGIEIGERL